MAQDLTSLIMKFLFFLFFTIITATSYSMQNDSAKNKIKKPPGEIRTLKENPLTPRQTDKEPVSPSKNRMPVIHTNPDNIEQMPVKKPDKNQRMPIKEIPDSSNK